MSLFVNEIEVLDTICFGYAQALEDKEVYFF
jgi:hypothetical protein